MFDFTTLIGMDCSNVLGSLDLVTTFLLPIEIAGNNSVKPNLAVADS